MAQYSNKVILAPMVRIGTLPTRLLAARYGADLVYSEELIDFKMLRCKRQTNAVLGTVDFIHDDGKCVFRTCKEESSKVIFQMGTADPERALKTAKLVEQDVAGVDVNMGCPKDYSVKGGMGAALLKNPERIREILTTLVAGVSIPVTCKIRILPSLVETLELVKLIESTGVAALAVHGRYQSERPRDSVHADVIRRIAETVSIPVIANGGSADIKNYEDMMRFREETRCSSVMVARAAESNPSVFRREGPLPTSDLVNEYVKLAVKYENYVGNTKYCLMMYKMEHEEMRKIQGAKSLEDICNILGLKQYYDEVMSQRERTLLSFQTPPPPSDIICNTN